MFMPGWEIDESANILEATARVPVNNKVATAHWVRRVTTSTPDFSPRLPTPWNRVVIGPINRGGVGEFLNEGNH